MKIYYYPSKAAESRVDSIVNRGLRYKKKDLSDVNRIVKNVKNNGDKALIEYTNRFSTMNRDGLFFMVVLVQASPFSPLRRFSFA